MATDDTTRDRVRDVLANAMPAEVAAPGGHASASPAQGSAPPSATPSRFVNIVPAENSGAEREKGFTRDESFKQAIT
jgi:hypothetical protein